MASPDLASPSPRSTLSKFRRTQDSGNDSTVSLASSSASDNADGDALLRVATDGPLGRLKERMRRKSVDERRGSDDSNRRLSTFMSGRRNKLSKTSSNDADRSSFVDSTNPNPHLSGNSSKSSLAPEVAETEEVEDGSGTSSLLTDDNNFDTDGKPLRPTVSSHPSHAGYLTLSSPDIQSQTQPVTTESNIETFPESASATSSTANIPQIIEPHDSSPSEPVAAERSPSPAEKLAKAFSLPRKKGSPDTESVKSASNGQGLTGLFRPSSRGSVVPQEVGEIKKEEVAVPAVTEVGQGQSDIRQSRPETPKSQGKPRIHVEALPSTPPNNLTDTPTTFVTPPTPTFANADASTFPVASPKKSPASTRADSIKHRRSQSANLPSSKLSHSIPAPLTPTAEETKTPGGTLAHPASATGFFSSVFSATQKAVDSLSSTINTSIGPNQKSRGVTSQLGAEEGGEDVIPGSQSQSTVIGENGEKKELAVATLGSGDLNLGHLGISEAMNSNADLPLQNGSPPQDEANKKAEQDAAARAISDAYEKPVANVVKEATGGSGRPLSIASTDRLTLGPGDQSPPRPGADGDAIKRSNSTRSKLSRRRHRGSSATTGTGAGNSIMAGLAASGTGLGNLQANGAGHRLTGFAVASNKRNKDFHQLFRSVPEDDYLIEDYSAALQRDILLHGRLYVSEGHICFSSNILGWVTNLVISFDEVVSVEKKSTAVIFPNAIVISTLHARNTFASFVARDSTYELLIGIWKISHPNLKSSLNGVTLDNAGTGDKTEVVDPEASDGSEGSESDDEVYDEDADDDTGSFEDAGIARSIAGSDVGADSTLSRKTSAQPLIPSVAQINGNAPKGSEDAVIAAVTGGTDFPGPSTHEPTQCTDGTEHYDRPLTDTTIPAPLGKVYSLMFGPASAAFMKKWLVDDQKSRELNFADSTTGLDNDHKTMTFDYIKPLNAPVGPKQTKCITTNTLVTFDLEKVVTVDCSTQTPDVPSGNVFTTKTRYCLMWGPGNSTRVIANCTIEWTGKSWLKGPIEKGANDGQIEYIKSIVAALKAAVTTKAVAKGTPGKKSKRKGRKEVADEDDGSAKRDAAAAAAEQQASNWGLLEPLHALLKPFISLLSPFITSQTIIAVLFVLLLYTLISPPGQRGSAIGYSGYTSPERLVAYGEMWRREESSLWDWLEDRVGVDDIYAPGVEYDKFERQKVVAAKKMGKKVDDERMTDRLVDNAIRVTEQRLSALKDAVARKKVKKSVKG